MKKKNLFILFGLLVILICRTGNGQDNGLVAYWPFDEKSGTNVVEAVKGTKDVIDGFYSFVPGVRGNALKFDGSTTRITREVPVEGLSPAPEVLNAVTFEAWIAP